MKTHIITTLVALLTSGALVACGSKTPPPDLDATATIIAANILATQTAEAPTNTPTPTPTQTPTHTPSPTLTPTHTSTATPTNTSSPTPTPTSTPTDTPTATPVPPTPTPTTLPPTPTPVNETLNLILEQIAQAQPLGGDKFGVIVINCAGAPLDWYIEEPREEHRLVAKVPAGNPNVQCDVSQPEAPQEGTPASVRPPSFVTTNWACLECGISQLEGFYSGVNYEFGFGGLRFRVGDIPAGYVGLLSLGENVGELVGSLEQNTSPGWLEDHAIKGFVSVGLQGVAPSIPQPEPPSPPELPPVQLPPIPKPPSFPR